MHVGNVFQTHHIPTIITLDNDVFVFFLCGVAAGILQDVLFGLRAQTAALAQLTRRDFYVLIFQRVAHVVGRQSVGHHFVGVQPHPHRIVARTENVQIADTVDALQLRRNVDVKIVVEKTLIHLRIVAVQIDIHQDIGFLTRNFHPFTNHLGRQFVGGRRNAVLHIHRIDVRVGAQLENHIECRLAVVTRITLDVFHAGYSVQGLFQRNNDRFHQQLVVGAGVVGNHIHLRRRNGGKLRDGKVEQRQNSDKGDDQRDDNGEHRSTNKDLEHPNLRLAYSTSWRHGATPAKRAPCLLRSLSVCRRRDSGRSLADRKTRHRLPYIPHRS